MWYLFKQILEFQRNKPPLRRILLWKQANTETLRDSLREFLHTFVENNSPKSDIDRLWDTFKNFCSKSITDNINVFFSLQPNPGSPEMPRNSQERRREHSKRLRDRVSLKTLSATRAYRKTWNMNVGKLTVLTSGTQYPATRTPRSCTHSSKPRDVTVVESFHWNPTVLLWVTKW